MHKIYAMNDENERENKRYGAKVDRIYRILLNPRNGRKTWYSIAKEASVSYGWAYRVLKGLEERKMIKGQVLKRPRKVFELWLARPDPRRYREYHVKDPKKVLSEAGLDYALTGYFAENLLGQYLFPRLFEFYIKKEDALKWHRYLSKKGLVGRGNVRVLMDDEHVFYGRRKVDGWPIVCPQQVIIDLLREGAECVEAADLLIKRCYDG